MVLSRADDERLFGRVDLISNLIHQDTSLAPAVLAGCRDERDRKQSQRLQNGPTIFQRNIPRYLV
jgi:hypothetical protein